jgi:hypothetical protein
MPPFRRLFAIQRLFLLILLCGMAVSRQLWYKHEGVPYVPMIPGIPAMGTELRTLLLGLVIVSMVVLILKPRIRFLWFIFLSGTLVLILEDWNRVQPWVIHSTLVLLTFSKLPRAYRKYDQPSPLLFAAMLAVAGLYFWSGIWKLNSAFFEHIIPYFMSPLTKHLAGHKIYVHTIGYSTPFLEIICSFGLIWKRTRLVSIVILSLLHLVVLLLLGPFGLNANEVVWSWNIILIMILWSLFFKNDLKPNPSYFRHLSVIHKTGLALILLAPALNFAGWYNKSAAFEMYSGTNYTREFEYPAEEVAIIPPHMDNYVYKFKQVVRVKPYEWTIETLGVPPNPDPYCMNRFEEETLKYMNR